MEPPRALSALAAQPPSSTAGKAARSARSCSSASVTAAKPGPEKSAGTVLLARGRNRTRKDFDSQEATGERKLLAKNPENARALQVISLIRQDKGDLVGAERVLRHILAKDPLDANALNSLGYMFADRGERLDEAVSLLERALKIEPGNPSYLDSLGWAYFQQGRFDLADEPLTTAAAQLLQPLQALDAALQSLIQ